MDSDVWPKEMMDQTFDDVLEREGRPLHFGDLAARKGRCSLCLKGSWENGLIIYENGYSFFWFLVEGR